MDKRGIETNVEVLVDDSPMYPDTEEYRQFNMWAATQGGNIDQCNYEAWKAGYRASSRLERQGKCGEGWQPIKTAPAESSFLACAFQDNSQRKAPLHTPFDNVTMVGIANRYDIIHVSYSHDAGCYLDVWSSETIDLQYLTHWMPLPKPPAPSGLKERK